MSSTTADDVVLSVADLHVRYGTAHGLQGVTFDVTAGSVLCLLGANGAGKSSLARAGALGAGPAPGICALWQKFSGTKWVFNPTATCGGLLNPAVYANP
jgi:ABC-type Mn2+/Zn2+ transport system ATPase subunit